MSLSKEEFWRIQKEIAVQTCGLARKLRKKFNSYNDGISLILGEARKICSIKTPPTISEIKKLLEEWRKSFIFLPII